MHYISMRTGRRCGKLTHKKELKLVNQLLDLFKEVMQDSTLGEPWGKANARRISRKNSAWKAKQLVTISPDASNPSAPTEPTA